MVMFCEDGLGKGGVVFVVWVGFKKGLGVGNGGLMDDDVGGVGDCVWGGDLVVVGGVVFYVEVGGEVDEVVVDDGVEVGYDVDVVGGGGVVWCFVCGEDLVEL